MGYLEAVDFSVNFLLEANRWLFSKCFLLAFQANALEVAQGFGGCWGPVVGVAGDGVDGGAKVGAAFERAADDVAGAEAYGEGESEYDAAEEDSEGELDDGAADLKVVEHHGCGEDEDEPFDAEREDASVLELGVDGSDEDGALEEASDDGAGDEQEDGSDGVGEVGDDDIRDLRVAGIGCVERGDADEAADEKTTPERNASDEHRGTIGGRPVGDGGDGVAGEAFVEFCGSEDTAKKNCQARSDGRQDDDGEKKRDEAGEKTGELDEDPVSGLA